MFDFESVFNNQIVATTIDRAKKYLFGNENSAILIDAFPVPYSEKIKVFTPEGFELASFRGKGAFSLPINQSEQATPSGAAITKGICVKNHTITLTDCLIATKTLDLDIITQTSKYYTSKAASLVGIFSPSASRQITKASDYLRGIYSRAEGLASSAKEVVDVYRKFTTGSTSILETTQTLLENLTLSKDNGNYVVHYCGKGYRKMSIQINTAHEYRGLGLSVTFKYSPEINTEQVSINQKFKVNKVIKGLTTKKNTRPQQLNGEIQDDTMLKAAFEGSINTLKGLL